MPWPCPCRSHLWPSTGAVDFVVAPEAHGMSWLLSIPAMHCLDRVDVGSLMHGSWMGLVPKDLLPQYAKGQYQHQKVVV